MTTTTTRINKNITHSIVTRELNPPRNTHTHIPQSHEEGFKIHAKRPYKLASLNPRVVFKTSKKRVIAGGGVQEGATTTNPVYDIQFCPRDYRDHRVIGVADEHGFLSIVKVGYEGVNRLFADGMLGDDDDDDDADSKKMKGRKVVVKSNGKIWNRGATILGTSSNEENHHVRESVDGGGGSSQEENSSPRLQPVLYSIDWNDAGERIVGGYGNGSIRVWDVGRGSVVYTIENAYGKSIKRVVWGSEATIISCSRTNEIKLHDNRMRTICCNKIDCNAVGAKLTDICVVGGHYVVSGSSNSGVVSLWDLRYTYKLYKRIKAVQSWDCGSGGVACLAVDRWSGGRVYVLGCDSVISGVDWRGSDVVNKKRVPGKVDYFSKLGVEGGVAVCGTGGGSGFGFDLDNNNKEPFFELTDGRVLKRRRIWDDDHHQRRRGGDDDKENDHFLLNDDDRRSCCAVGIRVSRGDSDCVQIATGGDDSHVTVWD